MEFLWKTLPKHSSVPGVGDLGYPDSAMLYGCSLVYLMDFIA